MRDDESAPFFPDDASEAERALLVARAARLRERPAGEPERTSSFAAFVVGGTRVAVPLEHVRACLPLRGVTPVPLAPPQVIGLLRFRGAVVTVFSLAALLGVRGWRVDPAVLLVVDVGPSGREGDGRAKGRVVAFDCEEIPVAVNVPASAVALARQSACGGRLEVRLADKSTLTILDEPALLLRPGAGRGA